MAVEHWAIADATGRFIRTGTAPDQATAEAQRVPDGCTLLLEQANPDTMWLDPETETVESREALADAAYSVTGGETFSLPLPDGTTVRLGSLNETVSGGEGWSVALPNNTGRFTLRIRPPSPRWQDQDVRLTITGA